MSQQQKETLLLPKTVEKDVSNGNGHDMDEEGGTLGHSTSSKALCETALSYGALDDGKGEHLGETLQECKGSTELESLALRETHDLSSCPESLDSQCYLH
jgi:hypothetical protein